MWKDKLKEVIYILENSDINEIEVRFWFRKIKVTKTQSFRAYRVRIESKKAKRTENTLYMTLIGRTIH